jgi:hypothetical protein
MGVNHSTGGFWQQKCATLSWERPGRLDCDQFHGLYYGPSADYERWAELVGNDARRWDRVTDRFKWL